MTKVVVGNLNEKGAPRAKGVSSKRIRSEDGAVKMFRTVDGNSRTFSEDLRYVFGRNVAKAREENKKIVGVTDVAPAKR